jgi:hypothetical protein
MPKPITQNTLFYGDNLPILREHVSDESMDLTISRADVIWGPVYLPTY